MEKIRKYKWWQYGSVALTATALIISICSKRTELAVIFTAILVMWVSPVFMKE